MAKQSRASYVCCRSLPTEFVPLCYPLHNRTSTRTCTACTMYNACVDLTHSFSCPSFQDKYADLHRMYSLFRRVEGGHELLRKVRGPWLLPG